ncbi:substrate-binding domain-containing protein [Sediminispirochaeta smaragdinae]|uniref:Transcriptional regulator, LacI family n=1 Tax=Sediminispirochaeta smaragdinae (strain DSM 11293 / JCM 15392 / SEBR 4228) TaxID=573413 RepID=E1R6S1_SEDSS|nr:LacI family DNA-binding transcriptional regulator [Sediminispirochaeta smaragdinae]ADK79203.1 transcriptional regulator, LacI family [Sediminispirochaeta smaragdinae DSM 11293]
MKKIVTQKDIAQALHIGQMTVYRALHNKGNISPELRERILAYADEVGYQANRAAQTLVQKKVTRIVLFSTDTPRFFWDSVESGIGLAKEQVKHFNYSVEYYRIANKNSVEYLSALTAVIAEGVDAVGLVNNEEYDMTAIFRVLDDAQVPYILFNIDAKESHRLCYIGPDYIGGGRLAAEFLGKCVAGTSKILVITDDHTKQNISAEVNHLRIDGFMSVMKERYPSIINTIQGVDLEQGATDVGLELKTIINESEVCFDAIYLVPPINQLLMEVLAESKRPLPKVLLHDTFPGYKEFFARDMITAIIFQNPIQQGFYAVKVLEEMVETGFIPRDDIHLVQEVMLAENSDLDKNHLSFD